MTRIFTDGAEFGDTLFWSFVSGPTASTGAKRSGSYSYFSANSSTYVYKNITAVSEFYARFAFYVDSIGGGPYSFFRWYKDTTQLGDLRIGNSDRLIKAAVNGTAVASCTTAFAYSTWNLVEVHVIISDSGTIQVKFNGVLEINYSGDTKPGADTTINKLQCFNTDWNIYLDDLALNDTNGSVDNSWCGDGKIVLLTPSGSGTTNNWLNSGSVSGSANYLYVDDFPSDSDTTYVYASGSSVGDQDQYALSNFTGGTATSIIRIFPEARAKMTTSGSDAIKIGYFPSGGTDQLSGSMLLSTNYSAFIGTSASANPATGLAWTIDDLNALEYVIEVADSSG